GMDYNVDVTQNLRNILTLSGKNDVLLQIQLSCEQLQVGPITSLNRVRADHQKSDIASALYQNARSAQIDLDTLAGNHPTNTSAYRRSRRNAEFAPHSARAQSSRGPRRHGDAVMNDFDFVFVDALFDQPISPGSAVGKNTIGEPAGNLQCPDLDGCHIGAGIPNRSNNCGTPSQARRWNSKH